LFTTYGVGELSAINAIAGSYAESVHVVHLVGSPSRRSMLARSAARPVHHALGDGRMEVYAEMAKHITCAQAQLHKMSSVGEAAEAYDEVLEQCVLRSKPGYVSVPYDMMEAPVPSELLQKALNVSHLAHDVATEDKIVSRMLKKLQKSRTPLLIADGLAYPFNLVNEANSLVEAA